MELLCEFDFEIKHIKGKENKVDDALSRKVHEMHVASLSIFQPDLRQQIVNHTAEDELYMPKRTNCSRKVLRRGMRDINWKKMDFLLIKNRFYIPNVAYLRRIVMDKIHQAPYSGHLGYQKTIAIARKQ